MSERQDVILFVDLAPMLRETGGAVTEAVSAAIDRGDYILGADVVGFEDAFSAWVGVPYAIGVGNGTDALTLSIKGLGLGAGDQVMVPANSYIATAEAVANAGAEPVFCDVHRDTLTIDVQDAERRMGPRLRAIVPVHLFGLPADMDGVMEFARAHDLAVIEDASQAHGASIAGRAVGSIGDIAAFSLYPSKNLGALGDAGIVVTDDAGVADRVRRLRQHGASGKFDHAIIGMNSRLDTLQAAVLRVKLPYVDRWNDARRERADRYRKRLDNIELLEVQAAPEGFRHVYHLFVVRVPAGTRDRTRAALDERGIQTGIHYPQPVHRTEAFAEEAGSMSLPVAEDAAERMISLPMYPHLSLESVDDVSDALIDLVGGGA